MSFDFEMLRPFTQGPARKTRIPAPPPAPNPTDLHLCFGKVGTLPTPIAQGFKICTEHYGELERKVHMVRIEDPEGSGSYIDVERADQIKFGTSHTVPSIKPAISSDVAADLAEFDAEMAADFAPFNADDNSECNLTVDLNNGPNAA